MLGCLEEKRNFAAVIEEYLKRSKYEYISNKRTSIFDFI